MAAAAFKESTPECIGIQTLYVAAAIITGVSPVRSLPTTSATFAELVRTSGGRSSRGMASDEGVRAHTVQPCVFSCLLYTSDAADERSSVDLGGRRIIKKKKVDEFQMLV